MNMSYEKKSRDIVDRRICRPSSVISWRMTCGRQSQGKAQKDDVETGEVIPLYAENVKEAYQKELKEYVKHLSQMCLQYRIKYVPVDIKENFDKILTTYLVERQKFK